MIAIVVLLTAWLSPFVASFSPLSSQARPFTWKRVMSTKFDGDYMLKKESLGGKLDLSGKIVVTGLGDVTDDEFTLTLLKDQEVWSSVVLASADKAALQKRFISRTSRYSGLVNVLEFEQFNISNKSEVKNLLTDATAWLAFNVDRSEITSLASTALDAGVTRVIFTTQLNDEQCLSLSSVPEFDSVISTFAAQGKYFTGIRHGEIIPGDDNLPYEIFNSSATLPLNVVPRGVLGRVASELLRLNVSANGQCGVSLSNTFTKDYLSILRQRGLTPEEEVYKLYTGSVDRFKQMYRDFAEGKSAAQMKKLAEQEERKLASAQERVVNQQAREEYLLKRKDPTFNQELDNLLSPTRAAAEEKAYVEKRVEEILQDVMDHFQFRLMWKKLNQQTFIETNREKARQLAVQEFREQRDNRIAELMKSKADSSARDQLTEIQEKQYQRLLSFERKELFEQQRVASNSIKYIYVLLEILEVTGKEQDVLFHNLDEFRQTLLLREVANTLRQLCQLPPNDVIVDPLDAEHIIDRLSQDKEMAEYFGLDLSMKEMMALLNKKHGKTLKKVAALRGAQQRIDAAIEVLQQQLPAAPPSVDELRAREQERLRQKHAESKAKSMRVLNRQSTNE